MESIDKLLYELKYYHSKCIYLKSKPNLGENDLKYSIIMPIYNQQDIIITNIKSIILNTVDTYETIIILDNCEDDTEKLLLDFFNKNSFHENLKRIIIIKNDTPLFETTCDNIGCKLSFGEYIVEIQADMRIITYGYNYILSKPCRVLENVIAVSGRLCNKLLQENGNWIVEGKDITKPLSVHDFSDYNNFYIYESCIRGPLLIDSKKLKELDYFDEINFFQHDSDHDLMARAFYKKGYICGYFPIEFEAPIHHGSGRKFHISSNFNKYEWQKREEIYNKHEGFYFKIGKEIEYIPVELKIIDIEKELNLKIFK